MIPAPTSTMVSRICLPQLNPMNDLKKRGQKLNSPEPLPFPDAMFLFLGKFLPSFGVKNGVKFVGKNQRLIQNPPKDFVYHNWIQWTLGKNEVRVKNKPSQGCEVSLQWLWSQPSSIRRWNWRCQQRTTFWVPLASKKTGVFCYWFFKTLRLRMFVWKYRSNMKIPWWKKQVVLFFL